MDEIEYKRNCLLKRRGQLLVELSSIDEELEEIANSGLEDDLIQAEKRHVRR